MNMLIRICTILAAMMLTVSCLTMAAAEENAVSAQNAEPASHILVVYFSGAGTWLEGKRFSSRTTVEELAEWAASLGIKP